MKIQGVIILMNHQGSVRRRAGSLLAASSAVIVLLLILLLLPSGVLAEKKINTTVTLILTPANPGPEDAFTLTGVLKSKDGELLGNKWIVLESTAAGKRPGTLQVLERVTTDTKGGYYFHRPNTSPPEILRIRYDGNYRYGGVLSETVAVKGAKPGEQTGDASAGYSGVDMQDTSITIAISPAAPQKGEKATITGKMMAADGSPAANEWLVLESTSAGSGAGDFAQIDKTMSGNGGEYSFIRSVSIPGESLRVRFAGSLKLGKSVSQVIILPE